MIRFLLLTLAILGTAHADSLSFTSQPTGSAFERFVHTAIPTGFGDGDFSLQFWIQPASASLGTCNGGSPSTLRTVWCSDDPGHYSGSCWWCDANFLLDGHNNTSSATWSNGTLDVQIADDGQVVRVLFGDGTEGTTCTDSDGAGPLLCASDRTGGLHVVSNTGNPLTLIGNWTHVAFVRDCNAGETNSTLYLYINGTLEDTETTADCTAMYTTWWDDWAGFPAAQQGWYWGVEKQAAIGVLNEYPDYKGLLDEIGLHTEALSQAQITALQSARPEIPDANMPMYWVFGEGSGATINNTAGSAFSGTLTNGTWSTTDRWGGELIFVDDDARGGGDDCEGDDGDGTYADPYGSLHYAGDQLTAGDVLMIRDGIYRESFPAFSPYPCGNPARVLSIESVSGTASTPTLIRPYGNEDVVIDTTVVGYGPWTQCESDSQCGACTGINAPGTTSYQNIYYTGYNMGSNPRTQIYVDPVRITDGTPAPGARLGYITADPRSGDDFSTTCSNINSMEEGSLTIQGGSTNQQTVWIPGGTDPDSSDIVCSSEVGNCGAYAIYIGSSDFIRVSGKGNDGQKHLQTLGGRFPVFITGARDIDLDNFYIHNGGDSDYGNAIRTEVAVDRLLIDNVDIEDVTAEGVAFYGGGVASCGASEAHDVIQIRNSTITSPGQDRKGMASKTSTLGDGIFGKGAANVIVRNNTVTDTARDGIMISPHDDCDSADWLVTYNTVSAACEMPRDGECAALGVKQHTSGASITALAQRNIFRRNVAYDIDGEMPGFSGLAEPTVQGIRQTALGPGGSGSCTGLGSCSEFQGNNSFVLNTIDVSAGQGNGIFLNIADSNVLDDDVQGNLLIGNSSATVFLADTSGGLGTWGGQTYWPPNSGDSAIANAGSCTRATATSCDSDAVQSAPSFSTGYRLAAAAAQVDGGSAITTATNSGSSSTSLNVGTTRSFFTTAANYPTRSGRIMLPWGVSNDKILIAPISGGLPDFSGSYVIEEVTAKTATNLTLANPQTWTSGWGVWLWESLGQREMYGLGPDIGGIERVYAPAPVLQ